MDDDEDICAPETDEDDDDDGEGNTIAAVEGASHPALLRFFTVPSVPSLDSLASIMNYCVYILLISIKKTGKITLSSYGRFRCRIRV